MMKAAFREHYCDADEIEIKDLETPVCGPKQIRVKVACTTVNRTDEAILKGKPWIMQLFTGIGKPKQAILGTDFAGTIDALGEEIKGLKVGDRLFGFLDNGLGSQAEYLIIDQKTPFEIIPEGVSFEDAVASAEGGHYAFNFFNKITIKAGDKVMLNGATGAIGSVALQMLKQQGAEVIATCRGPHKEKIKNLGADRLIDYELEDFTKDKERYDLVLDAVGKSSFKACKSLLKNGGIYISSELGEHNENPWLALFTPLFSNKKVIFPYPY